MKTCSLSFMGVLNVTPNSFSDGGNHNQVETFSLQFERFLNSKFSIFDIGAESTAPSNKKISSDEEVSRLKSVIVPYLKEWVPNNSQQKISLSIDTYKPETAFFFYHFLKEINFSGKIIWNDVSGIIDDSVYQWLELDSCNEYIFCSSHIPEREQTLLHMKYVSSLEDPCEELTHSFTQAVDKLSSFHDRVWLDPAFGFSKNFQQNVTLLKNYSRIINSLKHSKHLIGVSRKSFFRKLSQENLSSLFDASLNDKSELYHLPFLQKIISEVREEKELIFRVHEPFVSSVLGFYNAD